jgi:hypothetical protein
VKSRIGKLPCSFRPTAGKLQGQIKSKAGLCKAKLDKPKLDKPKLDKPKLVKQHMKILAIMQNQWFKNPEEVRRLYERRPDKRNHFIGIFLFMECTSGRRLQKALGEELCSRIIWEEASPEIGGRSASNFGADPVHIQNAVKTHRPDLIICFGKVSGQEE